MLILSKEELTVLCSHPIHAIVSVFVFYIDLSEVNTNFCSIRLTKLSCVSHTDVQRYALAKIIWISRFSLESYCKLKFKRSAIQ